jgi:nicotinamide-nucleotide amidase
MIGAEVVSALSERGQTVAVAESLTGGMVCAALIEVPGASAVVRGGVVAYATELKHRLLDVDGDLLASNGPVDPDVAAQMALGVRERLGADWGLATTGVAGPEWQDGVAPGRVYLAVAGPLLTVVTTGPGPAPGSDPVSRADPASDPGLASAPGGSLGTRVLELDLPGDRAAVRAASTEQAIGALLAALREVGTAEGLEQARLTGR